MMQPSDSLVQKQTDETVTSVRRIRDLVTGAYALLERKDYIDSGVNDGGDALRELLIESKAVAAVDELERQIEHRRVHSQAGKSLSTAEVRR